MPSIVSLSTIGRSRYDALKSNFSCENIDLESHIKQFAFSHQQSGLFQTYFYVDDDDNYLGYVSVSVATIEREEIDDEINISPSIRYSIPAIKITRLCTFDTYCGQGVGRTLMKLVNLLAITQQKTVGCRAIIVDSKPEAVEFYEYFDFTAINKEEDSNTIFMVNDLLKPNELTHIIPMMIEFCNEYGQNEFVDILNG